MITDNHEDLESLIRRYIPLGVKSPKGYEVVKCAKCNDYKTRGGFKFDGESIHYSCFNCSTSTGYNPQESRHQLSKKFKEVLISFGIPELEIDNCISFNFFKQKTNLHQEDSQSSQASKISFPTKEIHLPSKSVLVSSKLSPWCEVAEAYLNKRSLSSKDYNFYVTDETSYVGRILIPYYFRNKIVYWQGRSLDDDLISPRYKNPSVEKDNIIFNLDELYSHNKDPIFVSEGPIDAISLGKTGVALLGSTLTEFKILELKKASKHRKIIFVIDKNLNGYKLGNTILNEEIDNWFITVFPDNIEDSNDALQKLGKLWLTNHLISTSVKGLDAKLLLELRCLTRK